MAIQIGCGSWADPEYAGLLYPRGFPPDLRLSGYAMWFDHVEVNATYYSIPKKKIVARWMSLTPATFLFDIRLHRAFSFGSEKVVRGGTLIAHFLEGLQPLAEAKRLGTFLWVLSPSFAPGRHRLRELEPLIEKIRPHPLAVELRHREWVSGKARASTLDFFREQGLTWVGVDMPRLKSPHLMPQVEEVTQPNLAYLRLHGRNSNYLMAKSAAERHAYAYGENDLREIVQWIRHLSARAKDVRVVANNHFRDFAPKTALALKDLLGWSG